MAATFALMVHALQGAFEELYLRFVGGAATQAPALSSSTPLPTTIDSSKARYHLLSTHPVGGFLAVAHFWIPPMSSVDAEGIWSNPILMVIGAPTTTVDAQPVSRLALDLELAASYATAVQALQDAFEALYLHLIGATATQAPAPCSIIICIPPTLSVAFLQLLIFGSFPCRLRTRRVIGVSPS
jgi:hypothetical protein